MAIGDDAIAAGMSVLNGTEQADDIDLYINETRDFIAQRTSEVVPIAKGGTGATTALLARHYLNINATNVPTGTSNVQNDLNYLYNEIVLLKARVTAIGG